MASDSRPRVRGVPRCVGRADRRRCSATWGASGRGTFLAAGGWRSPAWACGLRCLLRLRARLPRAAADGGQPAGRAARGGLLGARAGGRAGDPLGEVFARGQRLGETLREQRLGDAGGGALLTHVMDEIDVAMLAFDEQGHAAAGQPRRRAAARPQPRAQLTGSAAGRWGCRSCWRARPRTVSAQASPGGQGPYELRRRIFRQEGRRTRWWCWRTCGRRCARRSARPGGGWSAC